MAVHAHPDDESSKGAATMARYVAEGVDVHVVTCTGGERGSILNPRLEHDESVLANLAEVRRREMDAAREILGVRQDWLGCVDSGLPEGDPLPPLPEGCFGLMDVEVAAEPLVRLIRSFRPHVMTTYDENGGYPHPDHIMCHKISVHAFDAAGDPTRYPDAGEPWQPLKLYYNQTFTKARTTALHEAMLAAGLESPYGEWLERWEDRDERDHHHARAVRGLLRGPRPGAARARHPGRPRRSLVPLPARAAARGLADRGLRAGPLARWRSDAPRTTCSPGVRERRGRPGARVTAAGRRRCVRLRRQQRQPWGARVRRRRPARCRDLAADPVDEPPDQEVDLHGRRGARRTGRARAPRPRSAAQRTA